MTNPLIARAKQSTRRAALSLNRRLESEVERRERLIAEFRALPPDVQRASVIDEFHRRYYNEGRSGGTWHRTYWLGTTVWKCPLDLWLYQELIHRLRPDLIIETGTAFGGSALYMAGICDLIGHGSIVSIDIAAQPGLPHHSRVRYLAGSSTDQPVLDEVSAEAAGLNTVMVILDSDHSEAHVANELSSYAPLVTIGSYLIAEDTNVNGHPSYEDHGPGPMEAVDAFLVTTTDFESDRDGEKFLLTFNPGGLLRRIR